MIEQGAAGRGLRAALPCGPGVQAVHCMLQCCGDAVPAEGLGLHFAGAAGEAVAPDTIKKSFGQRFEGLPAALLEHIN